MKYFIKTGVLLAITLTLAGCSHNRLKGAAGGVANSSALCGNCSIEMTPIEVDEYKRTGEVSDNSVSVPDRQIQKGNNEDD